MRKTFSLLALGLVINLPIASGQDSSRSGPRLTGAFTPARAMKLVYGSYDDWQGLSVWQPNRAKLYPKYWPDSVQVRVLLDAPYIESGIPKHLLVTWALPEQKSEGEFTCHSCGVLIGLTLFGKNQNEWQVEASDSQFAVYGSFGIAPTIHLQPIGPDHFALMMPWDFGGMGENDEYITVIVRKGTGFSEAFNVQTAQSWEHETWNGRCSDAKSADKFCVAYDGGVEFSKRSDSEYYDILLIKRVYRSLFAKVPEGTTISTYRFDGSKYNSTSRNAAPSNVSQ
jgi:hypothetical protein